MKHPPLIFLLLLAPVPFVTVAVTLSVVLVLGMTVFMVVKRQKKKTPALNVEEVESNSVEENLLGERVPEM